MKNPKYCERCGCYIPDLWDSCPSCGNHNDPVLNDIKSGRGIAPFGNLHPAEIPVELHRFDYRKMRNRIIGFAEDLSGNDSADMPKANHAVEYAERISKAFGGMSGYDKKKCAMRYLENLGCIMDEKTNEYIETAVYLWNLKNF